MNGKFRAVIFDMDGVLIDSHPAHRKAWRRFLASVGQEVSDEDLDFILDGRKRDQILTHFFGKLSASELEENGRRKDEFFQEVAAEVRPVAGVLEFLQTLAKRKILTAVATSASPARAYATLARLRLSGSFSVVVTSTDVVTGKPDPAIYRITCERLGVPPQSALAIEDALSGIRAARAAGLRCIAVAGHESANKLRKAGADHVISDFVGFSLAQAEKVAIHQPQRKPTREPLWLHP